MVACFQALLFLFLCCCFCLCQVVSTEGLLCSFAVGLHCFASYCNGITQSDYFPGVALRLFFIFNAVASHPNMHDYAKSITEPLLNLILLFCEKTRCFYHKIPSRFNANHIDKSQIKCACAAMQACAEFSLHSPHKPCAGS